MTKIEKLILSGKSVFNLQDLAVLWEITDRVQLVEIVKYYLRNQRFSSIRRGLYTLNENYSELDLAQKLVPLSYLTFHTALNFYGINYQFYNQTHSSSLVSKTLEIGDKTFTYHKLKPDIFYNQIGLVQKDNYTIASPERAICESFLFANSPAFDHLNQVSKTELLKVSQIYGNLSLEKKIQKLIKLYNL
jgi:hypothetical protein